ncbi:MAG: D-glycero-beta-D-manno-heptose-7-phosphate kinase [Acidobacteria bacterium]|nr:D-glycero-beta-D-manno-heptose-7-phosphate kinase [Acidobacteriota bacterium]
MKASDLLNDLQRARLLVIGDIMLDRYWWGSVDRISPEAPVPVVRLNDTSLAAGGAANVALNISGLGCESHLVGVTGDDQEALELKAILDENGVGPRFVRSGSRKTTVKTRIVAHGQHVVRIDQEDVEPLTQDESHRLIETVEIVVDNVDAVVLSDYGKGTFTGDFLTSAIELVNRRNKPIFVDPKGSKFDKYKGVTAITPNQREAMTACSIDPHEADPVPLAGKLLSDSLGASVLITEGEKGMTLFENGARPHHFDSFAREVFDVTGAGDTVIGVFAAAVAAGRTMIDAAWLANVAAGLVVGRKGTTAITRATIEDFLASAHAPDLGLVSTA